MSDKGYSSNLNEQSCVYIFRWWKNQNIILAYVIDKVLHNLNFKIYNPSQYKFNWDQVEFFTMDTDHFGEKKKKN